MASEHYKFFQNKECDFFPCHEIENAEEFNCLFCYCPLYLLKEECGGNYSYDNPNGIKDCSGCMIPHGRDGYDYVMSKSVLIIKRGMK